LELASFHSPPERVRVEGFCFFSLSMGDGWEIGIFSAKHTL